MSHFKVFHSDNQELTAYLNDKDLCYIAVGQDIFNFDNFEYCGNIVLDKQDLAVFILELQMIYKSMP